MFEFQNRERDEDLVRNSMDWNGIECTLTTLSTTASKMVAVVALEATSVMTSASKQVANWIPNTDTPASCRFNPYPRIADNPDCYKKLIKKLHYLRIVSFEFPLYEWVHWTVNIFVSESFSRLLILFTNEYRMNVTSDQSGAKWLHSWWAGWNVCSSSLSV